jgi:hypothetical protein
VIAAFVLAFHACWEYRHHCASELFRHHHHKCATIYATSGRRLHHRPRVGFCIRGNGTAIVVVFVVAVTAVVVVVETRIYSVFTVSESRAYEGEGEKRLE